MPDTTIAIICESCGVEFQGLLSLYKVPSRRPRFCTKECGYVGSRKGLLYVRGQIAAIPKEPLVSNWRKFPCLDWSFNKNKWGYGTFYVNRKREMVHRIAYELFHGHFDKTLKICHHCDRPSCYHPRHLFLGTPADNVHDCIQKGRARRYLFPGGVEHCKAKLNDDKVREIRILYSEGKTLLGISRLFDVSVSTIHGVTARKFWKHVI